MPWETRKIKNEDIISTICSGNMNFENMVEMFSECINVGKKNGITKYLSDNRKTNIDLSAVDIYDLPKTFMKKGLENWSKVAVIISSKSGKIDEFKFFETVSQNIGYNVKIFKNEEKALTWLKK
jgi:hypothetical protein